MNRVGLVRQAENVLAKFQLTRPTIVGTENGFFDVASATQGNGGSVWLHPNGEFCEGAVFVTLPDLEAMASEFLPSEREWFLIKLCGKQYNRI